MNRRDFLNGSMAMFGVGALSPSALAGESKTEWLCFSRVFQKFGIERAAELIARAGYTGMELTVRKGGFVEPSQAKTELPKALKIIKARGLSCDNIIVGFLDPYDKDNLDTLKCAADNGVKVFRPEYFLYDTKESATKALDRVRKGFDKLEKAARETGVRMLYQNHSTCNPKYTIFGALGWDLWEVLRERDPKYVGTQYDYMHARAEQGPSWQRSLSLLGPWIGTLCLKDFRFEMDSKRPGVWKRVLLPPGEGGICDWQAFKAVCDRENIKAPYTVHYDYNFPEDNYEEALKCSKRDLERFQSYLS